MMHTTQRTPAGISALMLCFCLCSGCLNSETSSFHSATNELKQLDEFVLVQRNPFKAVSELRRFIKRQNTVPDSKAAPALTRRLQVLEAYTAVLNHLHSSSASAELEKRLQTFAALLDSDRSDGILPESYVATLLDHLAAECQVGASGTADEANINLTVHMLTHRTESQNLLKVRSDVKALLALRQAEQLPANAAVTPARIAEIADQLAAAAQQELPPDARRLQAAREAVAQSAVLMRAEYNSRVALDFSRVISADPKTAAAFPVLLRDRGANSAGQESIDCCVVCDGRILAVSCQQQSVSWVCSAGFSTVHPVLLQSGRFRVAFVMETNADRHLVLVDSSGGDRGSFRLSPFGRPQALFEFSGAVWFLSDESLVRVDVDGGRMTSARLPESPLALVQPSSDGILVLVGRSGVVYFLQIAGDRPRLQSLARLPGIEAFNAVRGTWLGHQLVLISTGPQVKPTLHIVGPEQFAANADLMQCPERHELPLHGKGEAVSVFTVPSGLVMTMSNGATTFLPCRGNDQQPQVSHHDDSPTEFIRLLDKPQLATAWPFTADSGVLSVTENSLELLTKRGFARRWAATRFPSAPPCSIEDVQYVEDAGLVVTAGMDREMRQPLILVWQSEGEAAPKLRSRICIRNSNWEGR